MKVIEILDLIGTLQAIHNQRDEHGKPILQGRIALQVAKAARDIEKQVSPTDIEDQRKALLDTYGEKDENGKLILEKNRYKLADEATFNAKWQEIIDTEFDIQLPKIPEAILDMVNMTGDQALAIEPLLENEQIKIKE